LFARFFWLYFECVLTIDFLRHSSGSFSVASQKRSISLPF